MRVRYHNSGLHAKSPRAFLRFFEFSAAFFLKTVPFHKAFPRPTLPAQKTSLLHVYSPPGTRRALHARPLRAISGSERSPVSSAMRTTCAPCRGGVCRALYAESSCGFSPGQTCRIIHLNQAVGRYQRPFIRSATRPVFNMGDTARKFRPCCRSVWAMLPSQFRPH